MDELGLAVHADVSLHAEIPSLALRRPVHFRVPLPILVLRRARRADDRRSTFAQDFSIAPPQNLQAVAALSSEAEELT
jgi:hypothetical protein